MKRPRLSSGLRRITGTRGFIVRSSESGKIVSSDPVEFFHLVVFLSLVLDAWAA